MWLWERHTDHQKSSESCHPQQSEVISAAEAVTEHFSAEEKRVAGFTPGHDGVTIPGGVREMTGHGICCCDSVASVELHDPGRLFQSQ